MRESSIGSFLAGAVIGGLVGAATGLLLASESGEELRGQVNEFVGGRRAAWDEAVNEGRAAADRARAELVSGYDADADANPDAAAGGSVPEAAV